MLFGEPTWALNPEMDRKILDIMTLMAEKGMTMLTTPKPGEGPDITLFV